MTRHENVKPVGALAARRALRAAAQRAEDVGWASVYGEIMGDRSYGEAMESLIPAHMRRAVTLWIVFGQRSGDFLARVIENDLFGASLHADDINAKNLAGYARFFVNCAPKDSYGRGAISRWTGIIPANAARD